MKTVNFIFQTLLYIFLFSITNYSNAQRVGGITKTEVEENDEEENDEEEDTNITTIVWSKTPLNSDGSNLQDTTSSFSIGDAIYGAFLVKDGGEELFANGRFYVTYYIDDNPYNYYETRITFFKTDNGKSVVPFTLIPSDVDNMANVVADKNLSALKLLENLLSKSPIKHTIMISCYYARDEIYSSFTLDRSNDKNGQILQDCFNRISDLHADEVRLPNNQMENSSLSTEMTTLANKYPSDAGEKYTNCVIARSDWTVKKDAFGNIISRNISACFVATYPDGHCEMICKNFSQDYADGKYGALKMYPDPTDKKRMNCENVPK